MFSSDEREVGLAEVRSRNIAQIAHNHLTGQILRHMEGTCRCRTVDGCHKAATRAVRFAAAVMRTHGAQ